MGIKKYLIAYGVEALFSIGIGLFGRDLPYRGAVMAATLIAVVLVGLLLLFQVRDFVLRSVKKIEPQTYEKLTAIPASRRAYELNIDKNADYSEPVCDLLDWWRDYQWINFGIVALTAVLTFCV